MQPSEGGSMFSRPTWRQHLTPFPSTRESSASVSSHMSQPSNYLGGSLLSCLLSVFPVLESKTKHSIPDVTSQVPTKDLMSSLGLLTVLPWTQCGLQSPFIVALVKSHSELCSIWYPPGLQGFSAHTCVASHAPVGLLHRAALLFHMYLSISCVLWPLYAEARLSWCYSVSARKLRCWSIKWTSAPSCLFFSFCILRRSREKDLISTSARNSVLFT